ncbi:hypothetical protein BPAE_0739g00020 [Botrytis paeoniae]|uniref:gluconokinase n=1 Tax=Botrytis paeoniae TaxID=278948 RepID=A0A4Z1ELV5_9HELO|nr:hypothetical protein BPAE_0739g00020 [Botrytis paeoniae]
MIDIAFRSQQPPTLGTEVSKHIATLMPNGEGQKKTQPPEPRTIDELIRLRALENAHQNILSYPQEKGDYVDYTFHELDLFAFRVAQRYSECIPLRKSSDEKERVIGLLGPSNLDYFITILALSKLGFTVLFLSTRISTVAYRSLLEATSAQHLLIHESFAETAEELQSILPTLQVHKILTQQIYESNDRLEGSTRLDRGLDLSRETNKICWIIHLSGSTGLPKPIYQTHNAALMNYKNHLGMRGFITLPLYHAHGISSVFRALSSRKQIHMYSSSLPLTQKNLLNVMTTNNFEIFYAVPYALKLLCETEIGIEALKKLKVVMFGGSACSDTLGDRLVDNGVNLVSHYGTTETGQLMTSFRQSGDKAWNYLRPSHSLEPFLRWEPIGQGIYELIVLDGWPSKVASNRPDGAYATKDLFTPHPTIPGAWKYYARSDDTIVLLNGEKAVPTMIEQAVRQHRSVQEVVIFGNGMPLLGMVIIPSEAMSNGSTTQVIDSIWSIIEEQNISSAAYAHISRLMIKVLPVGTSYPRTDKGTVIRQAFYEAFKSEIENAYTEPDVVSSREMMFEEPLRDLLRKSIREILGEKHEIEDTTDLFSLGMDSLQALRLRTIISSNLPIPANKLGMNIAFEFPSVSSLATELFLLQQGSASESVLVEEEMQQLIDRYGDFPSHKSFANSDTSDYVVLTGSTGSLGAHLVAQLAMMPNVRKIYCLVRGKSQADARLRVISSLRKRSMYHTLGLTERQKIIALPSQLSDSKLGLSEKLYSSITDSLTLLIHCAWKVNFNLRLGSFEKDCIAGARNFLLLCLAARRPSPARFTFCSSVSAVASTPDGHVPEAVPASLNNAQSMGYAQSKLVTEHIVQKAAQKTGILARTLRVGQIIGDTQNGIWNSTEAIPLMLQAGLTIGAIPALDESILWLPVDKVSKITLEISMSNAPAGVMNLVAHKPIHWTRELLPKLHQAGLNFEEIGQREWISRLRSSNRDPVANPPIKLIEFFANKYDNDNIVRQGLQYDTRLARSFSPTLEEAQAPDQKLISKIINRLLQTSWKASADTTKTGAKTIIIAGPCGSGKSTVATALAQKLLCPHIEGDTYHSSEAHERMKSGIELTDEDRWSWLQRLHQVSVYNAKVAPSHTVIVSCSALKKIYRDKLRSTAKADVETIFILLQVDGERQLRERMDHRVDHYMGSRMIGGQIQILENPEVDEEDTLPVDATKTLAEVLTEVVEVLSL